jgi:hypothetical protein
MALAGLDSDQSAATLHRPNGQNPFLTTPDYVRIAASGRRQVWQFAATALADWVIPSEKSNAPWYWVARLVVFSACGWFVAGLR